MASGVDVIRCSDRILPVVEWPFLWPVVTGVLLSAVSLFDFLVAIVVSFPYTGGQGGLIRVPNQDVGGHALNKGLYFLQSPL